MMAQRTAAADDVLAELLLAEHPDEAARVLETARDVDSAALLDRVGIDAAAAVLRRLTPDRGARVLAALGDDTVRGVVAALNPARVATLLARLDEAARTRCLALLDQATADELRALAAYEPDSAGSLMDPRVTTFRPDATVGDVVGRLRRFRDKRIHDVFLVGEDHRLAGCVALQDVVPAGPDDRLSSLAHEQAGVPSTASREEVVQILEDSRADSLPVVDFDDRLLGVLRHRELVRAAKEQATVSAVTMTGASGQERALSSPAFAVRKRLPWLQINLLTAFLAAAVVGVFEGTIAAFPALAVLLPVVAGQSGNTGAQALAVTMRGLALREVRTRDWLRVAGKEVFAGAGNGIAVALTTSLAVYAWSRSVGMATVIGVSMVISMTMAGLAGAAIPMLLTAMRQDPAQSSSIFLTTVTDIVGFFSFLGIATLMAASL
jgi:magnesium transporter